MEHEAETRQQRPSAPASVTKRNRDPATRRCLRCGYSLASAPETGTCPECGNQHSPATDYTLQPWPSRAEYLIGICWPLSFVVVAGIVYVAIPGGRESCLFYIILSVAGVLAPINTLTYSRTLLSKHVPVNERERGAIFWMHRFGFIFFALIVVVSILLLLVPLYFLGSCLVN